MGTLAGYRVNKTFSEVSEKETLEISQKVPRKFSENYYENWALLVRTTSTFVSTSCQPNHGQNTGKKYPTTHAKKLWKHTSKNNLAFFFDEPAVGTWACRREARKLRPWSPPRRQSSALPATQGCWGRFARTPVFDRFEIKRSAYH